MPESVFGIPTQYIMFLMVAWMTWAAVFGKHNRLLARLSIAGLIAFLAVPFYIVHQEGQLADYPVLSWVGLIGFMTFLVSSVLWCVLDSTPIYRKLFRRNHS